MALSMSGFGEGLNELGKLKFFGLGVDMRPETELDFLGFNQNEK